MHKNQILECFLQFRSLNSVPFHKRAIRERLQKKGISIIKQAPDSNTSVFSCYIEAKLVDEDIFVRIGKSVAYQGSLINSNPLPFDVQLILYSPNTAQEIADFFRLSMVFGCEIVISKENGKLKGLLQETKATLYKGIDKIKYQSIESLKAYISEQEETTFCGFSSWSRQGEPEFLQFVKYLASDMTNPVKEKQLALIFGNEKGGLHYRIQKSIQVFKLGAVSEPLRSTQVGAYGLACIKTLDWILKHDFKI